MVSTRPVYIVDDDEAVRDSMRLLLESSGFVARDFVPKPWDNERLLAIVRTQIELGSALRRGRKLEWVAPGPATAGVYPRGDADA